VTEVIPLAFTLGACRRQEKLSGLEVLEHKADVEQTNIHSHGYQFPINGLAGS
jgi:hypothetical protein